MMIAPESVVTIDVLMRWVVVCLLALLASGCATPFAQAPSASPSATPAAVARTARTTLTPRPAPTATPARTTRPSPTTAAVPAEPPRAPVQTPRPALGLPVSSGTCSEWPREREVFDLMTQLALPSSLCLLRATRAQVGQIVCTVNGCVPIRAECLDAGSCIEVIETEHPHYVLVYAGPDPAVPAEFAEGHTFTRHLCRLHQERTRIDAALRGRSTPDWVSTLEGSEFVAAFSFFRSAYPQDASRWGVRESDAENYAEVCAAWYYPYSRDLKVASFPALATFAQKWLPR